MNFVFSSNLKRHNRNRRVICDDSSFEDPDRPNERKRQREQTVSALNEAALLNSIVYLQNVKGKA